MKVKIGDVVTPKTVAGLCLADVPIVDGNPDQKRKTTCVLKGKGTVLAVSQCVIDYDTLGSDSDDPETPDFRGIGKLDYINVFVKCDAGQGWCGTGALNEYA